MSAIDVTVKGVNSNSYVTEAAANTYFEDRLHGSSWTSANSDDKRRALIWAARILDTRITWKGTKTTLTQAMDWPRAYVPDPDATGIPPASSMTLDEWYLDADTIPKPIQWAQTEQALLLLASDLTLDTETTGFSSLSVGSISVTIDRIDKPAVLPRAVRDLVRPYIKSMGTGQGNVKMVRT